MTLDTEFLGNSLGRWLSAAAVALGVFVAARATKAIARSRWRSSDTSRSRAVLIEMLDATHWVSLVALALFAACIVLDRSGVTSTISVGALCILLVQIGAWAQIAVGRGIEVWRTHRDDSAHARTVAVAIKFVVRLVVWSIIVVTVLAALGVRVTALVAGLGIGGLAIALAIQSLLGDVLASFSMYFDRPFDIGDTIVVDETEGTVERIGWRSTRLHANHGEEVILANGELLKRQIHNLSRVKQRHFELAIHLEYANAELAARVPTVIEQTIDAVEGAHFEHAYLKRFGRTALVYEIEFSVEGSDQRTHKDRCHAVNLGLLKRFSEHGIRFSAARRSSASRSPELGKARPEVQRKPS